MSKRKRQWSRRGEARGPRPPWGWLLVGLLLLVGAGIVASGQWPVGGGQPRVEREPEAGTSGQGAVDGGRQRTATPRPTATRGAPSPEPSPARLTPQSPRATRHAANARVLSPGRLAALTQDVAGGRLALATAGGIGVLEGATLAEAQWLDTGAATLAVALVPGSGEGESRLLAVTADGRIHRRPWPAITEVGAGPVAGPLALADKPPLPLSAAFLSPDGALVAVLAGTARSGEEIRVYDTATGALEQILSAHGGRAAQVLFLPAGEGEASPLLLSRGSDGRVRLWHRARWRELPLPPALTYGVGELAVAWREGARSPLLAAAHQDGGVSLWNARTWQRLALAGAAGAPVRALALAPGGELLAAAREDGTLALWQTAGGDRLAHCALEAGWLAFVRRPGAAPDLLALGPDGRLVLRAGGAAACGAAPLAASDPDTPFLDGLAYLATGPAGRLAAAGAEGRVFLWELAEGRVTGTLDPGGPVGALAYGPDGRLATGGVAGPLLWDGDTGAFLYDLGGHVISRPGAANVIALAFSPAERAETAGVLASADRSGLLKVWRAEDGALLRNLLPEEAAPVTSLTFSADGYTLLAGGGAGLTLWQPRRGQRLGVLAPAGPAVAAPAPVGAVGGDWEMVAVLAGARVDVYDGDGRSLGSLQAVPTGEAAAPAVTAAAFVRPPAGAGGPALLLATGHADGSRRLWAPATGELLALLSPQGGAVTALAVDGCTLLSAGAAGTLRVDEVCGSQVPVN